MSVQNLMTVLVNAALMDNVLRAPGVNLSLQPEEEEEVVVEAEADREDAVGATLEERLVEVEALCQCGESS